MPCLHRPGVPPPLRGGLAAGSMVEQPISISYLKYFAADRVIAQRRLPARGQGRSHRQAGGHHRRRPRRPHRGLLPGSARATGVTVVDAMPQMGGMLRYGIPEYRLPKKVRGRGDRRDRLPGCGDEEQLSASAVDVTFEDFCRAATTPWWWPSAPGPACTSVRCPGEDLDGCAGRHRLPAAAWPWARAAGDRRAGWPLSAAATPPWTPAAPPCAWARRRSTSSTGAPRRRCPPKQHGDRRGPGRGRHLSNSSPTPPRSSGRTARSRPIKLQVMELGEPDACGRRASGAGRRQV